ncbi:MAG: hypothetical protein AAFR12_03375 [Cyanobacteria bacterium J06626_6]
MHASTKAIAIATEFDVPGIIVIRVLWGLANSKNDRPRSGNGRF